MSSLKDLASLIMIPSLVKDGRLDTVKPLGNSIIHPDATGNNDGTDGSTPAEGNFTFSRGSNLAATRVDVNGLIEKGKENLLLQSNQFDTTWTNVNTTETSGQSGYDGTNDAWLLSKSAASARIQQSIVFSGVNTFSVYAKAGTLDWVMLNNGSNSAWFDLANGLVGIFSGGISSDIESIGGGWYRCSFTGNITSGSVVRIYPAQNDNNVGGTSGNIVIQDAQLEKSLVATPYIETGASTAQAGILEDLPRLDYSGGASCPSLLLEPQRSNLVPQSEYFSAYDYTFDAITATYNATISPDGLNNATKITRTSSSGNARLILGSKVVSSGAKVTISIFAKENTANDIILYNTISTQGKRFDLSTGTAGADFVNPPDDFGIEDYGNGWYRCHIVVTAPSTEMNSWIYISEASISSVYFYGLQMEEGSYPTSYIPTMGSAVTRSLESYANNSATNLIGQTEGVLFIDFVPNTDTLSTKWLAFLGGGSNYIGIYIPSSSNNIRLEVADTTNQATFNTPYVAGQRYKCAIAYANNDVTAYANGVQLGSDTNASIPSTSTIRSYYNLSNIESSDTNQLLLFKTRLTNAELAALTTI